MVGRSSTSTSVHCCAASAERKCAKGKGKGKAQRSESHPEHRRKIGIGEIRVSSRLAVYSVKWRENAPSVISLNVCHIAPAAWGYFGKMSERTLNYEVN